MFRFLMIGFVYLTAIPAFGHEDNQDRFILRGVHRAASWTHPDGDYLIVRFNAAFFKDHTTHEDDPEVPLAKDLKAARIDLKRQIDNRNCQATALRTAGSEGQMEVFVHENHSHKDKIPKEKGSLIHFTLNDVQSCVFQARR